MKIAICDDSIEYAHLALSLLSEYGVDNNDITVYTNGNELLGSYNNFENAFDVIFLDMEMPDINGIETGKKLRKIDERVIIVFVTSYEIYMKESFLCEPFRFLLKPLIKEELFEVMDDIERKLSKKRMIFSFNINRTCYTINQDDIIYMESIRHNTIIHTLTDNYTVNSSISSVYTKVDNYMFYQVHKSYVVNLKYIKSVSGKEISLHGCAVEIPISRNSKGSILGAIYKFNERFFGL